jgi:hypothetical protein
MSSSQGTWTSRRMRSFVRTLTWLVLIPALALAGAPDEDKLPLQPYRARYQVSYRGLVGGQIAASLQPGPADDRWTYETHAFPNILGRLAISSAAHERGTMEITADGVRPLAYEYDDGKSGDDKDIRLEFDWDAMHVTGTSKGKALDQELKPGTQDTASVQAAMIRELVAGRAPQSFRIITGGKVGDYRYWSEGNARVTTPLGEFDTVIWANQKDGSSRVTKAWHAPSLGFVPVQAIQYRDGQAEMQMRIVKLER